MTACGWCIGVICAGITVLIKPEEVFDPETLAMELITIFVFQAIAGITIAIRLRFEGEKGRLVLPFAIIFLSIFVGCYLIGYLVNASSSVEKRFAQVTKGIEDTQMIILVIVLSLLVWFISYIYSMRVMKKKEF